jgi:hypothetical protein
MGIELNQGCDYRADMVMLGRRTGALARWPWRIERGFATPADTVRMGLGRERFS